LRQLVSLIFNNELVVCLWHILNNLNQFRFRLYIIRNRVSWYF